jgi:hypothetical protein
MRYVKLALCLAAVSAGSSLARTPRSELTVVTAGNEQGLKYGGTLLSRPFGAQLVDTSRIVGSYGSARERYYLVEGSAGANCPARYLIVTARPGQPPALSAPFGTCGIGATVRPSSSGLMITVAPGPTDRLPTRYSFGRAGLRQLDLPSRGAMVATGAPGLHCPAPHGPIATDPAAMAFEFDRVLPADYRSSRGLHRAEIAPDELRAMVAALACFSSVDASDPTVAKAAVPLFASKRYGDASFAALDQVASTPGSDPQMRASARAFSATMRYYVLRREAL